MNRAMSGSAEEKLKAFWDGMSAEMKEERHRGRWINVTTKAWVPVFQCSECGEKYVYQHNFCPNCGTEMMRGEDGKA